MAIWGRLIPVGACGLMSVLGSQISECERSAPDTADAELRLVQVLFRHGARTPLTDKYWAGALWESGSDCRAAYQAVQLDLRAVGGGPPPESKYDKKQMSTIWPGGCAKGELTVGGQEQSRDLGRWLRGRYVEGLGFLPPSYAEGVLAARTTNYARTRATLQGVVTGLYPGTKQAVPVVTSGDMEEILIGTAHSCAQLSSLLKLQAHRLREAAERDSEGLARDERVRAIMGLGAGDRLAYTDLYDALTTLKYHGKGWPEGMTETLYQEIEQEAVRRMAAIVSPIAPDELAPDIMSLSVGQLVSQMTDSMEAIVKGESKGRRLVLLSGHDTTIMPVLVTLTGTALDRWPGYLSNIVLELWQKKGGDNDESSFFVRAFYNQEEIQLRGASEGKPLSLADFKEQHWLPFQLSRAEYLEKCGLKMSHDAPAPQVAAVGGDSVQGL